MAIYLITTALSALLGHYADKIYSGNRIIFAMISVLPFCLLAGWRADTIGTDVLVYARPVYEASFFSTLPGLLTGYFSHVIEPLFLLVTWIIAQLSKSLNVCLFFYQFLVTFPIILSVMLIKQNNKGSFLFANLIYGLIFFPFTLNIMRQSIAAAFLLLCVIASSRNNLRLYIIILLISIGFHITASFGIIIWPLTRMISKNNNSNTRSSNNIIVFIISIFMVLLLLVLSFGDVLLPFIAGLKQSFSYQVKHASETKLTLTSFLLLTIAFLPHFINRKRNSRYYYSREIEVFFILIFFGTFISQASIISPQLNRLGIMFLFALIPQVSSEIADIEDPSFKLLTILFSIVLSLIYFMWIYVISGNGDVIPYSSSLFPVLNLVI